MPFTFAHPAIVLPLVFLPRKWVSMTALVIGSVMPDAESYLRTYSEKELTHSWAGFFVAGLPFGLLLCFVFHNIVRNPLIYNLPLFLQKKFVRFTVFDWNKRFKQKWPVIIISLVVGGASHFFWDSFSHFDSWIFQAYPRLRGSILLFGDYHEIPFIIQYISTFIGIVIICIFVGRLPANNNPRTRTVSVRFWLLVLVVFTMIFLPRKILLPVNTLDDILIAIFGALAWALIVASLFFEKKIPQLRVEKK